MALDEPGEVHLAIEASLEDQLLLTDLRATITDLSKSAMHIKTDHYLPKGTKYRVTMKRPPFLSLRGQVRAIQSVEPSGYQIAFDLIDLGEEDSRRIGSFLEAQRRRLPTNG